MVRTAYKNERSEEQSCRLTGRIGLAKDYDGRKMRAFADSVRTAMPCLVIVYSLWSPSFSLRCTLMTG